MGTKFSYFLQTRSCFTETNFAFFTASGSGPRFYSMDLFVDNAARNCRNNHWLDHLGRLPDTARRHSDRSRHLLPEPHPQWNHLAYRVHAHRPQVKIKLSKSFWSSAVVLNLLCLADPWTIKLSLKYFCHFKCIKTKNS